MRILTGFVLLVVAASSQDVRGEIEALLDAVRAAEKQRDYAAIGRRFDYVALLDQVRRHGIEELDGDEARALALAKLRSVALAERLPAFRDARLRKVRRAGDRAVAVLDMEAGRLRWFLVKRDDGWRFYDFESVDLGLRFTASLALGFRAAQRGAGSTPDAAAVYRRAAELVAAEDFEAALKLIDSRPPGEADVDILRGWRELVRAAALLGLERHGEVLASCDAAANLIPGTPFVDLLRAAALNGLERHGEALPHARRYAEAVGPTAFGGYHAGTALLGLERRKEAEAAFREALAEDAQDADNVWGLAMALPPERFAELAPHFRGLEAREDAFLEIAHGLDEAERWADLFALVALFRETDPGNYWADYWQAWGHSGRNEHAEAARLAKAALGRVADPEDRAWFVDLYLEAMVDGGQPLEALAGAPNRAYAFRWIASELASDGDADALAKLLALRAEDADAGGALRLWQVEHAWLRDAHEDVVRQAGAHDAAIRDCPDEGRWRARDRWVRSLLALDRKQEAHELASRIAREDGDSYYLVMSHAALGHAEQAIRAFERCVEKEDYEVAGLYRDADIGPRLQGEAYRLLRLKYPPPPEKE